MKMQNWEGGFGEFFLVCWFCLLGFLFGEVVVSYLGLDIFFWGGGLLCFGGHGFCWFFFGCLVWFLWFSLVCLVDFLF